MNPSRASSSAGLLLRPMDRVGTATAGPARLSAIIPVLRDDVGLERAYRAYADVLDRLGPPYEVIYVLGEEAKRSIEALNRRNAPGARLKIVVVSRFDGEAAAIRQGLGQASGEIVLMLPAFLQVDPAAIPEVLAALDHCEFAVARRRTLVDARLQNAQAAIFHRLIRALFGRSFSDLVCRVRACRREVLEAISGYGAQPHFLPLLASERGFRVHEVEVPPFDPDTSAGRLNLRSRLRLALDALALYVVLRFLRKPLHFFGAIGVPILAAGLVFTAILAIQRLFLDVALADRPVLILSILLIVLGIQVIALGLIGEIIIFASGRRMQDSTVERVIGPGEQTDPRS
jgi:Glycosyl transferase family 2